MPPSIEMKSTRGSPAFFTSAASGSAPPRRQSSQSALSRFELFNDLLDIFPDKFFITRIAQKIGWMERRHELDALIFVPLPAQPRDRLLRLKQALDGEFPEPHDDLRPDEIDLLFEERLA